MMNAESLQGKLVVPGYASADLLYSDVGLSFWGGVDPLTSEVIDLHHPLCGRQLKGCILAIPSGRGSCTGSSVLLELILSDLAPAAIIFKEVDEILALGVIVAEELFKRSVPILCLGEQYERISEAKFAQLVGDQLHISDSFVDKAPQALIVDSFVNFPEIALTEFDELLLGGAYGEAAKAAMKIVLRMAQVQGADSFIDIHRAHIDGCIYTGPGGLLFANTLLALGAQVRVPTTLNSISVDERRWRLQGIPDSLGVPAVELAQAYLAMGAVATFTCAPYLLEDTAVFGEQIVWAESNAVVFANSVLGARTNKYADFMDICTAITGRAPLSGCHIDKNRYAEISIHCEVPDSLDDAFFPVLGYLCGKLSGSAIPVVSGLEAASVDRDALKAFGAAFGTTSAAPMFHMVGVTPEAATLGRATGGLEPKASHVITTAQLLEVWRELDSSTESKIDLVSLGNPHFSFEEFQKLAILCEAKVSNAETKVIVTTSRAVFERASNAGLVGVIEKFGAQIITDTCWCMVSEPVIPPNAKTLITNSGKYAHYAPGLVGRQVRFSNLEGCIAAAVSGSVISTVPAWLEHMEEGEISI
ncbi:aconitase X [Pseudomonas sp. NPDC087342]|uniref:cis-3-hydroxy-L-proline dehydratase n=1 Tax=Pseudomonas sp. NPDC087342 TaxID=3364437 RepID=UPI0038202D06